MSPLSAAIMFVAVLCGIIVMRHQFDGPQSKTDVVVSLLIATAFAFTVWWTMTVASIAGGSE